MGRMTSHIWWKIKNNVWNHQPDQLVYHWYSPQLFITVHPASMEFSWLTSMMQRKRCPLKTFCRTPWSLFVWANNNRSRILPADGIRPKWTFEGECLVVPSTLERMSCKLQYDQLSILCNITYYKLMPHVARYSGYVYIYILYYDVLCSASIIRLNPWNRRASLFQSPTSAKDTGHTGELTRVQQLQHHVIDELLFVSLSFA